MSLVSILIAAFIVWGKTDNHGQNTPETYTEKEQEALKRLRSLGY